MKKFDFIGFSSLNTDYFYQVHSNKPIGKFGGGAAANSICGLSKLGFNCGLFGILGKDVDGIFLKRDLNKWGIDTSKVLQKSNSSTGKAKVVIEENGQRRISYEAGINKEIEKKDINEDYFLSAYYLHLSTFFEEKQLALQIYLAQNLKKKLRISLLLDELYVIFGYKRLQSLLRCVDFLFTTKEVISELTNLEYEEAATKLLKEGCQTVSIIKSPYQSYLATQSRQLHLESDPFKIIDSTGYSCAYAMGFLYGMKKGKSFNDCARLGNAAMSFCSVKIGARTNLPDKLELTTRSAFNQERKKILIVGGGGREFTLGWKLAKEKDVDTIYTAPGNAGTLNFGTNVNIDPNNTDELINFVKSRKIDFTIVGPEVPLANGIVDYFVQEDIPIFGPSKKAAEIESSKVFAKRFMKKFKVPTAKFKVFNNYQKALAYTKKHSYPLVVKADGLASGKGVFVCQSQQEAEQALKRIMIEKVFGDAGNQVIIEECLFGEEASVLVFTDGKTIIPMIPAQDHKPVFDGDKGPNTGGMGCYAPAKLITPELMSEIKRSILIPTIKGMEKIGRPYRGVLYAGLMITSNGPKVLEFNCRFGDPETQAILPLLKGNLLKILMACMDSSLGKERIDWKDGVCVCTVLASAGYPGDYEKGYPIKGLDKQESQEKNILIVHAGTEANVVTSSGRVLGITAIAPTISEARKKVYYKIKKISFKKMHYRTDIGVKAIPNNSKIMQLDVAPRATEFPDLEGKALSEEVKQLGIDSINDTQIVKSYKLEGIESEKSLKKVADELLVERLWQDYTINKTVIKETNKKLLEIAKKPGVMDPEAQSIVEAVSDLGIKGLKAVATGKKFIFFGKPKYQDIKLVKEKLLMNKTIEREIKEPEETLILGNKKTLTKIVLIRIMNDKQLMTLSKNRLWLNLEEMRIIQYYFNRLWRDPTDVEIETIAQTWSEHCCHKTFKAKLSINGKTKPPLIERIKAVTQKLNRPLCLSVFKDNSGVIEFNRNWAICGKVETHNSPSAIEPYGGAATGSGGVFRDIMGTGKGAKVILSTNIFCFAPLDISSRLIPSGCLHPKRLSKGVVQGVRDYGNRMGIPTANGSLHFDLDWRAKPTVIVGAFGIMPKKFVKKDKPKVGDLILTVGGRTGRDGLHGVTFASGSMIPETETISSSAVQIGNAIEQKRMLDAILKVRDKGYIRTITDSGGGGYSSAIGEMAKESGCEIWLEKVPLKYKGLANWEIWLSESQERMVLAIPKKFIKMAVEIFNDHNVEATVIGKFTNSKKLKIYDHKKVVCDLSMNFLHHGLPQRKMKGFYKPKKLKEPKFKQSKNYQKILKKLLASWDVCSKEPIVRQYDHEVQGGSVLKPFGGISKDGPNNAAVIEPILGTGRGMAVSHGLNPVFNKIDPYWGSASAIDEAVRNLVAIGTDPEKIALLDNFIWPTPDKESLGDLDRAVGACCDIALAFKMPFVSGKDSLSSTYKSDKEIIKIPPTVCISAFAPVEDINKTVSSDLKEKGNLLFIIGKTKKELGGSAYYKLFDKLGNYVPQVEPKKALRLYKKLHQAIEKELIKSCHDCSEGGLAVTLAEMCFGGKLGVEINLNKIPKSKDLKRADFILFSESNSRFVVEVERKNKKVFEKLFEKTPYGLLGETVRSQKIIISYKNKKILNANLKSLKKAWQSTMRRYF